MEKMDNLVNEFLSEEDSVIQNNRKMFELLQQAAVDVQPETTPNNIHTEEVDIRQQLVDLMPVYPVLWNTSLRSFKDINKKEAAWKEISAQLKNVSSK